MPSAITTISKNQNITLLPKGARLYIRASALQLGKLENSRSHLFIEIFAIKFHLKMSDHHKQKDSK